MKVFGEAMDGPRCNREGQATQAGLDHLDFSMPLMNGIQAASVLSRLMPSVPLILFTMHAGAVLKSDARSAGITIIVSKDQGPEVLVSQAQTLLGVSSVS